MTTIESLQALTDEQLIEKVAVEVMAWTHYSIPHQSWFKDSRHLHRNFDPLTDWNHTMEVARKCLDDHGVYAPARRLCDAMFSFDQRAICLAALLSLAPSPLLP